MRLKDFFNETELEQFENLQFELLEAHNKKQRLIIQTEIDELISLAQIRYDSLMNGNGRQETSDSGSPKRLKDLLTEEEDIKLQELKMELLAAPNEKVRTIIMTQINEILDSAENRYKTLDEETRFSTMHPIKFKVGNEPSVYKLYKLEHEGHYTYAVLTIKDGELISESWPIEEIERNLNNGVWKEVK
ncbi:hypothetical protein [Robertmurraya sp. FSL R5-0851]|uniref:hypothetical protein n=1 Tax=Robertmurraya sp. FSL R5-0851 TaxID=2921584 RepID=UPI0030F96AD8